MLPHVWLAINTSKTRYFGLGKMLLHNCYYSIESKTLITSCQSSHIYFTVALIFQLKTKLTSYALLTKLKLEVVKLNDHYADRLFQSHWTNVIPLIFSVNRYIVDVERFEDDKHEPMSAKGMGALYSLNTGGHRFNSWCTLISRRTFSLCYPSRLS